VEGMKNLELISENELSDESDNFKEIISIY
jgi:hypothetical protein